MAVRHYIGIFFSSVLGCAAQEDSFARPYFKPFDDNISARLSLTSASNSFSLIDKETNAIYNIVPNDRERLGVSISYRSIAFSFGYAPNFLAVNKDNDNSKLVTFNFRGFYKRWTQSFDFYKQSGFNLESGNQTIPLNDVKTLKIGGQTTYSFNPNFSFRAFASQTEWQQRSAGTFAPTLSFYYTKLRFKLDDFDETGHVYTIAISPAYYYNFIIKKHIFLSLGALPGIGVNYVDSNTAALYQIELAVALGYNSDTFFGGITSNGKYFTSNADTNIDWNDSIAYGEIYFGYRFKPPKKLTETTEKVNQKLHLKK